MGLVQITDREFAQFQRFIYETAGISLSAAKKPLVSGRLGKRLAHYRLASYAEYFKLLQSGTVPGETQMAVDLLTTNETYLFREPKHFEYLQTLARNARAQQRGLRVWSAACSTGEEVYSIAMVLADHLAGMAWEVMGSDISTRVLEQATRGLYPLERAQNVPQRYLQRFCLRGIESQAGSLLIERELRQRVKFMQVNLNAELPRLGSFDVIFLRNVMIYFNGDTKQKIVNRVVAQLKPGGSFLVGHSESLTGIAAPLQPVAPSIYRKL